MITFEKASKATEAAILRWLDEPHVREFWDTSKEHREDIIAFIGGRKTPSSYFDETFTYWVALIDTIPFALLMTSPIEKNEEGLDPVWRAHLSTTGRTYGLDFMIGEKAYLSKGLGAKTLEAFTRFIREEVDPWVDTFFIDPEACNTRAWHVYEKAGFKKVACFTRDVGERKNSDHLLMIKQLVDNQAQKRVIERAGYRFHCHTEGSGSDILVIGSALYYSRSISKTLYEQFKITCIDYRGFAEYSGSTPQPPATFDDLIEDIEVIRNKLGITSCILMGHSAHALLALEYAKKYPQYVSHVVMIGISPNLGPLIAAKAEEHWERTAEPQRKRALEKQCQKLPNEALMQLSPPERFVAWCVRRGPMTWYDFTFDASVLWEGVHPNMPVLDAFYGVHLRDLDITQNLNTFNTPVLLCLGRYDFIIAPASSWNAVKQAFPNLSLRLFEKSGHSPHFEEPEQFKKELTAWLKENKVKN